MPFPSDDVIEKAEHLHVYPLMSAGGITGVVVRGYTDAYRVFAHADGVMCDCRAGSDHGWTEPRCSHALAAMLYWAEQEPRGMPPAAPRVAGEERSGILREDEHAPRS